MLSQVHAGHNPHMKPIMLPDSKFRTFWNYLVLIGILWYGFETPARLCINFDPPAWMDIGNIIVNLFFFTDLLVNFRTAHLEKGRTIKDPKAISKKYLKSWFGLDLFATIPFDYILMPFGIYTPWCRINHLIRYIRIYSLFRVSNPLLNVSHAVRVIQFCVSFLLVLHWVSCLWLVVSPAEEGIDNITAYNTAVYWTVTTLTTVGYGDITPHTNLARIMTIITMIIGVGMYGFVIGNVSTILVNANTFKAAQKKKMNDLATYMEYYKVPKHLQDEVFIFYAHLLDNSLSADDGDIIADLPAALQNELRVYSNLRMIEKVPLFQGLSMDCMKSLAKSLKQVIVAPTEYIIREGEAGREMYFIGQGSVNVLVGKQQVASLKSSDFFGEIALLQEVTRTASIVSASYCDLFKLEKEDFLSILKTHADLAAKVEAALKERKG